MTCKTCDRPGKLMNTHPVFCHFHGKQHWVCGVCVPELEKLGIIEFSRMTMAHETIFEHARSCITKATVVAVRLSL